MLQFQSEMVLFASETCNLTTGSVLNPKINYNNVNVGIRRLHEVVNH